MKNKGWFFGDSYTYGFNCTKDYPYYHKYSGELDKKIWPELVCDSLNLECINYGIPGNSNGIILSNILQHVSEFKHGDTVFISDTFSIRIDLFDYDKGVVNNFPSNILFEREWETKYLDRFFKNSGDKEVVVDFLHKFRLPSLTAWTWFYRNQFQGIKKLLDKNGVKCYLWSSEDEHKQKRFQTIVECTKDIFDDHWSFKGHLDFSKKVLENIYNNKMVNYIKSSL